VQTWQRRLTPLAVMVAPAEPPADLWHRIAASTAKIESNVVPLRRLRFWQACTVGALGIAASVGTFVVLRPPVLPTVAILMPITGGATALLATSTSNSDLWVRPNGPIGVPDGRDLELWALASGEARPLSLGVLPVSGRHLRTSLATDTQLLVSLEPRGGSPTGQPTGPVIYSGRLIKFD
jgi:anti-sigma-K factor RskA